ncbi:flagellar basal body-associated protein FliL [Nitrospina gracilis Nb-211]|nr:flagellar basal body-associated protein FliL [Nitrospina gracilis Nb-211]
MREEPDADTLGLGKEPVDPDLPEEVTAPIGDLEGFPDSKDWDEVADSAKALEDEELAEAAQHAEALARSGESATETSESTGDAETPAEPADTVAEEPAGLVDPEIWLDAFTDEPQPEPAREEEADAPFEDPELWAEAFADEAAQPAALPPEAKDEVQEPDTEEEVPGTDAWAEMFAEMAPEDDQWEKTAAESEVEPTASGSKQAGTEDTVAQEPSPPEEIPPGEPEEVPPESEPVPSPPPQEIPPGSPEEVPPEPEGRTRQSPKSWEDLESELNVLEEQRKKLKNKNADQKLKQLEEQRLMLELERQKLQGEVYAQEESEPASNEESLASQEPEQELEPETATAANSRQPESKPQETATEPLTTVDEWASTSDEPDVPVTAVDDDVDVIGLDDEFAEQEKEVIGLDEEFARTEGTASPESFETAAETPITELHEETSTFAEEKAAPVESQKAPIPAAGQEPPPSSEEEPQPRTTSKPLHPEFTALENLGGEFFSRDRATEEPITSAGESAMFDDLGKMDVDDWSAESPAIHDYSSVAANEEPDDFTAAFFGQAGEPDMETLGKQEEKTESRADTPSSFNWTESLDDSEEESLTNEEQWEREFPDLEDEEEEEDAPATATADDPFSEVTEFSEEEDADAYDDEDAQPIVIGREYDDDAAYDDEGFEGLDESAYEDDNDDDNYDLAFQEKKGGLFSMPRGRKSGVIIASVIVGLLLLGGTGYFLMQTFTPSELTDSMVANGKIPEDLVPHKDEGAQTPLDTHPEMQDLLTESEEEKKLDIDQLMGNTKVPQPKPEPETETTVVKEPEPKPGNQLEEAAQLLEPSEDNELLKELEQSEILKESQQEIEQAVQKEEKLARFIDPNATIVTFNTILPVAYNTTDIRVLSFRLEIEMDTPDSAEVIRKALPVYENMMVSTVERFFQQRFYTDVVYAKEKLRDKLRDAFNKSIENGKIRKANFTDFAIQ